ncbi:MAG: class I SAM-dependent RNA methyltransferase [Anaerolineae bacterium]
MSKKENKKQSKPINRDKLASKGSKQGEQKAETANRQAQARGPAAEMSGPVLSLKLTGMAHGGEAFGRDDAGRIVFVPYAIPGEEVRVQVVESKKDLARGRLVEITAPSPARVTPRCPHFGPIYTTQSANPQPKYARGCGGCQWQHIEYQAQLDLKTGIVREQFARIGKLPDAPVMPARGSNPWNYRNHMQFALDPEGRICLQMLESHDLIPIRECQLMDAPVESLFATLELEGADFDAVRLRAGENTGDRMIIFEATGTEPPEIETDEPVSIHFEIDGIDVTLIGREALEERVRERTFRISAQSFFQVNTPMAETLLAQVERYLDPRADETLLDAYGGVGLFGLSLAPRVARVIEVEENPRALADARHNAREWSTIEFHEGRVEDVLPELQTPFQLVVVDPPRAGMERGALDALIARQPRVMVYVSCDPATLARDARRLVDGGYRLTEVQPVDLFPQTYHIECVARFERK